MRPKSIAAFEYLEVSKIVLGFAFTLASEFFWSILSYGLMLWVVLLISRRRSATARWIYVAMFVFGTATIALLLVARPAELMALTTAQIVMMAFNCATSFVALWLLLSPSASRWLASPEREAGMSA